MIAVSSLIVATSHRAATRRVWTHRPIGPASSERTARTAREPPPDEVAPRPSPPTTVTRWNGNGDNLDSSSSRPTAISSEMMAVAGARGAGAAKGGGDVKAQVVAPAHQRRHAVGPCRELSVTTCCSELPTRLHDGFLSERRTRRLVLDENSPPTLVPFVACANADFGQQRGHSGQSYLTLSHLLPALYVRANRLFQRLAAAGGSARSHLGPTALPQPWVY